MRIFLAFLFLSVAFTKSCLKPRGAEGFTREKYEGFWYEIAKYQTAGGAFFEKDCVCTQLNVYESGTDYKVNNICRQLTPDGKVTQALGSLVDEDPENPGHYKESFFGLPATTDYTVIALGTYNGEEYSIEYDCSSSFLQGLQYCVHILSRKPQLSQGTLEYLLNFVDQLQLNQNNLPLHQTLQEGCWHTNIQ